MSTVPFTILPLPPNRSLLFHLMTKGGLNYVIKSDVYNRRDRIFFRFERDAIFVYRPNIYRVHFSFFTQYYEIRELLRHFKIKDHVLDSSVVQWSSICRFTVKRLCLVKINGMIHINIKNVLILPLGQGAPGVKCDI